MKPLPDIEVLREMLTYCPESGELRWSEAAPRHKGREAGALTKKGYRQVQLTHEGVIHLLYAHRICYALHHGVDPYPMEIDHINRIRNDNAISNLRIATRSIQMRNRKDGALDNTHAANRKPIRITYPNGDTLITDSINAAAYILNTYQSHISIILARRNNIHKPTGAHIAYA